MLLVDVAGLSYGLADRAAAAPHLKQISREGFLVPLQPSFPAVTSTVQASLSTGRSPASHAIIANGYYDRSRMQVSFWEQSDRLVEAKRVWQMAREQDPNFTSAMLFWQNSIGSANDWIVTPKPIHKHSGGMIQSCYSRPPGLYDKLARRIGKFNLFWYWGPFTSMKASRWITRCTVEILKAHQPHLVLTYLPHMDYNQQREGPEGASVAKDLQLVDECLGELADAARTHGYTLIVAGDYAIEPVRHAIFPNQALRAQGFLLPYTVKGLEYLDYGQSRAFAMVDHQVAHVFCEGAILEEVRKLLAALPGIERILNKEEQAAWGVNHPRSGELLLVAAPGYWFAYPWWQEPARRPDFATHVDIHNKPGYDPLELFWERHPFRVAQDASRIRGSHGRRTDGSSLQGLLATNYPCTIRSADKMRDTDVAGLILEALGLSRVDTTRAV